MGVKVVAEVSNRYAVGSQQTTERKLEIHMKPDLVSVSALLPVEFVPQFYRWVADAHQEPAGLAEISKQALDLQQTARPEVNGQATLTPFVDTDPEQVGAWWAKLSDTARDVLTFMAHNADERFNGTELAEECENLAGPSGAAGTFNWPSRHAKKMGFEGPWHWDYERNAYYMPAPIAFSLLAAINPAAT